MSGDTGKQVMSVQLTRRSIVILHNAPAQSRFFRSIPPSLPPLSFIVLQHNPMRDSRDALPLIETGLA